MKALGLIVVFLGFAILVYVGIKYFQDSRRLKSPVPQDQGIKVIYLTPAPSK